MLHTVSDVMTFQAVAGEDGFPVADVFVDGQGGRIRFVALDIGGWFESSHAIISDSRFDIPDTRSRIWPVDISKEEIETQPRWNEDGWFEWFSDLTAMPMLYAGPASMGYDPLMIAQIKERAEAQERAKNAEALATAEEDVKAKKYVEGLLRCSVLLGMTARGHGEDLGHIGDLLFDASRMRVSHVVIDNEKVFVDSRYCIPFEQLREVDEEASEAHLDLTLHSLTTAPKRTVMDSVVQSSGIAMPSAFYHVGL